MTSCKDCIHVDICEFYSKTINHGLRKYCESEIPFDKDRVHSEPCELFKDRSRFVELPYPVKPRDKVWYILEGLDEIDLSNYDFVIGNCAVGNQPDTVIDVGTQGFWVNQLSDRNVDVLMPDDCDFIRWEEIGKSYFLTKEAAEQALKERENDE